MNQKKRPLFSLIKKVASLFCKRPELIGKENLPTEPVIFISNHAQMHGPLISELYFPRRIHAWCIGDMMKLRTAAAYAYKDFWSAKPKSVRWFYKLLSYPVAPIATYLFNSAEAIPVYKDARLLATVKNTIIRMEEGRDVLIFPECSTPYNEIINEFQDKFIDVARFYYKKTKKEICFVPTYIAPTIKKIAFGKPVRYDHTLDPNEQRKKICDYLKSEITALAKALPVHKVVPYLNVSKKEYPLSK